MKYAALLCLVFAGAAHAQLHKCVTPAGKVEYQQGPCADPRSAAGISGGTMSGVDAMPKREIQRAQRVDQREAPQQAAAAPARSGAVPTDRDIKNLETSASSTTLGKKEREFLQAEVRRAKAAQREGGTYTKEDWDAIKEGQASQNRISARERKEGRENTEAVHESSASDNQKSVLKAEKDREAQREAARRQAAAQSGTVYIEGRPCQRFGDQVHC